MNRTIVIGDIHGCYEETIELLEKVEAKASDRVIFVGDLVDRGPDPKKCIELAMQHECVIGNHEDKHIRQRRSQLREIAPSHVETRKILEDRHYDYFSKLPHLIRLPEYNAAIVHAGVFPGLSLEEQDKHHVMHIQNIKPPNKKSFWPSKAPADYRFWTNFWKGPERIIFGHTVLTEPLVTEFAVGIDTGAVFGHQLTAVVLPEWKIVQVPSKVKYLGRRNERFQLHGAVQAYS